MYLIINKVHGYVSKGNYIKLSVNDKEDAVLKKYNQVFAGIKHHIDKNNSDEFGDIYPEVIYNSRYDKIKFLTDDSLPLGKLIYFPSMTVIINCVFKKDGIHYPQVYLDDCLHQI